MILELPLPPASAGGLGFVDEEAEASWEIFRRDEMLTALEACIMGYRTSHGAECKCQECILAVACLSALEAEFP